jgi:hypothetical protein
VLGGKVKGLKGRISRSGVNWTHFMKIIFVELSYEGSKI